MQRSKVSIPNPLLCLFKKRRILGLSDEYRVREECNEEVRTDDSKSPCEIGGTTFTDPGTTIKPPASSSGSSSSSPASAAF